MKAVIFDLDGTLVDSAPDIHAASAVMLKAMGRELLSLATIKSFVGNGVPKLVERCVDATGGGGTESRAVALRLFRDAYAAAPCNLTRFYPGVEAALDRLAAGGVALAVCTNKPAALTEALLAGLGARGRFGAVVGGDSTPRMKPDPTPLFACMEAMGAGAAETFYVGDSEADEAAALNAGLPFALYTGGYRKKAPDAFAARFAFDEFADLADRLEAMEAA